MPAVDALFQRKLLESIRRTPPPRDAFIRIVVVVDLAFGGGDETGIIKVGKTTDDEISMLFLNDMRLSRQICQQLFVNFDSIAQIRQAALLSMVFNLGVPRSGKFYNMRADIAADDCGSFRRGQLKSPFIARLGLAVGGKSGGFAKGLKQRRVSLALFGNALHRGFGRAGICDCFGDAAFNRIMPL